MDIIIIGAGKFGRTLCGHLEHEGHNITVLEQMRLSLTGLLRNTTLWVSAATVCI